jgi:hypothetical protein
MGSGAETGTGWDLTFRGRRGAPGATGSGWGLGPTAAGAPTFLSFQPRRRHRAHFAGGPSETFSQTWPQSEHSQQTRTVLGIETTSRPGTTYRAGTTYHTPTLGTTYRPPRRAHKEEDAADQDRADRPPSPKKSPHHIKKVLDMASKWV